MKKYRKSNSEIEMSIKTPNQRVIETKSVIYHAYIKRYPNGKLYASGLQNAKGEEHGLWKFYWEDDKLMSEGVYKNGNEHGEWVEYWDNGKIRESGKYNNGDRVGEWRVYTYVGSLHYTKVYDANVLTWIIDRDGRIDRV